MNESGKGGFQKGFIPWNKGTKGLMGFTVGRPKGQTPWNKGKKVPQMSGINNNSDCNGRIESHHILNWIDYPELRYEVNNGITLCRAHHPRGRKREAELSPYLQSLVADKQ